MAAAPRADPLAWTGERRELRTARLVMSPLGAEHLEEMASLYADPEVTRYLAPLDERGHEQRLAESERSWRELGYGRAAVREAATGRFVGRAGLVWWPGLGEVEANWAFRRDSWGQGYATEAARAWVDWGLKNLDVEHLTANIHPDNAASLAVARRLGMTPLRRDTFHGGPVIVYCARRPIIA